MTALDPDAFGWLVLRMKRDATAAARAKHGAGGKAREAAGRHVEVRITPYLLAHCVQRMSTAGLLDALVATALQTGVIRPADAAAFRADAAIALYPSRAAEGL